MKAGDNVPISFVCNPAVKQAIEEIAAAEGLSISDIVRRAIRQDIRRRRQELAADAP